MANRDICLLYTSAGIEEAIISAIGVSSCTRAGFTPDYQRIPEEVSLLARERNYFRKRWQSTRDPADKATFNRLTGRLRGSLKAFRCSC